MYLILDIQAKPWMNRIQYKKYKCINLTDIAHGKLPFSFNEMWVTNRTRNRNILLRNADIYYIPAHKMASVKRFPFLYSKNLE